MVVKDKHFKSKTLGIDNSITTINHRILDVLTKTGKRLDFLTISR